jgi:hypothetical protein
MHSLRHSLCSLLISSGVSPVYAQQQAGHADVALGLRKLVPGGSSRGNGHAGEHRSRAAAGETGNKTGRFGNKRLRFIPAS